MATPHGFSNPQAGLARALVINTPDIGAGYFREMGEIVNAGGPPDRAQHRRDPGQQKLLQWLSRGSPKVVLMRWYFTAGLSTMPSFSSPTMARWISCQGVWLGGYG